MTDFQKLIIETIEAAPNKMLNPSSIAVMAKTNRLAAYSSCESLVKKGILSSWRHGEDQWAILMYAIKSKI